MSEDKFTLDDNTRNDEMNSETSPEQADTTDNKAVKESDYIEDTDTNDKKDYKEAAATEETDTSKKPDDIMTAEAGNVDTSEEDGTEDGAVTKKKPQTKVYKLIHIVCIAGFVIFSALFVNEVVIQPIRIKHAIDLTRELYNKPTEIPKATQAPTQAPAADTTPEPTIPVAATPTPDPNRDEQGRLLQFKDLLAVNSDVKGWLTIPDTNIDYVVVQSSNDNPEYYLDKDINLEYSKAGTLFMDYHGSVEFNSQNLVIHGHNMVSTAEKMFHYLLQYKKASYYKKHPLITFDTIYRTGEWKIFAVFITNGTNKKEPLFDYTRSYFTNSADFLNFVYQLRIRSVLNIDSVDIKDDDQLLMLSTCSYEVDNYRTVIVARRVRDGEDPAVDVDSVTVNKHPLYPESYYYRYGGKAPELPATFEEAMANGDIDWYKPAGN